MHYEIFVYHLVQKSGQCLANRDSRDRTEKPNPSQFGQQICKSITHSLGIFVKQCIVLSHIKQFFLNIL